MRKPHFLLQVSTSFVSLRRQPRYGSAGIGDLENRGLIYRKHGKGTFANGHKTRIHRYLGILDEIAPGYRSTGPSPK